MKKKLMQRLRRRGGFTISELLITVLILSMVAAIMAAGMPAAVKAFTNAVDSANAQLLLTTAMTELRDELGTAESVDITDGSISYTDGYGNRSTLSSSAGTGSDTGGTFVPGGISKGSRLLVSRQTAGSEKMYVWYESAAYDSAAHVVTFTNLAVMRGSDTMLKSATYQVRVMGAS